MSQPVVLIVFYSRGGTTEKLALAAAVGAVQSRAIIRLRRVPDPVVSKTTGQSADYGEAILRMRREYVAPTEADILGADALILAAPAGSATSSAEWSGCIDMLARLASTRKLKLKVVAIVESNDKDAFVSFSDAVTLMGLPASPAASGGTSDLERATVLGRRTAQAAAI